VGKCARLECGRSWVSVLVSSAVNRGLGGVMVIMLTSSVILLTSTAYKKRKEKRMTLVMCDSTVFPLITSPFIEGDDLVVLYYLSTS
jgi:3D (Asp-Asp-Asp) domain-containing protein